MKITHNPDVERAELAVETNLSKFSSAVGQLEDKIIESRSKVEAKVEKVKNMISKPKNIMNQVTEKAHQVSGQVSNRAQELKTRTQQITDPYMNRGYDLGKRFWHRAEAHPVPFIIGAAAIFGGVIYWMISQAEELDEPNWGWKADPRLPIDNQWSRHR